MRSGAALLPKPWTLAALLLVVSLVVIALAALGWPASRYRDTDFAGFWLGSRALLEGLDPYDVQTWAALHERIGAKGLEVVPPGTGFGYPLTTALVFAPFALLPLTLAAPAWIVSQAAFAVASLLALIRHLARATFRRDAFVLIGLVAGSQPAWLLAGGGNVGGFVLALAATATTLLIAGHPMLAGIAAGALLITKPLPLLIAMLVVLAAVPRGSARRMLASASAVVLGALAISVALRPAWIGEFLAQAGRVAAYAARTRQATVFGLLGPDLAWLAWSIVAATVVVLLIWTRTRPPIALVAGVSVAASLFCVPYGWSYDHLSLAITAGVILALVATTGERARLVTLLALAVAFVVIPWTTYALAFARGGESLSAVVPLGVLLLVIAVARRDGAALRPA